MNGQKFSLNVGLGFDPALRAEQESQARIAGWKRRLADLGHWLAGYDAARDEFRASPAPEPYVIRMPESSGVRISER